MAKAISTTAAKSSPLTIHSLRFDKRATIEEETLAGAEAMVDCAGGIVCIKRDRRRSCTLRSLQPTNVVKCISKDAVERRRINLVCRIGPILGFLRIVVLVFPCGLSVIECRRVARELKFLHHRVRPT